jgi:hypothetical protein
MRILLALLLSSSLALAAPGLINHQGRIAVNGANVDGTAFFKFAFVDGTGSQTYWTNDGTGAGEPVTSVPLAVAQGHYATLLGDTNEISPSVFADHDDVRLRIWFSLDNLSFEQLSPDRRIASAGYALSVAAGGAATPAQGAKADTAVQQSPIKLYAAGTGASTPVSEWLSGGARDRGYADLAAIQADYPHVAGLTDQVDWAVIQGELDAVGDDRNRSRDVVLPTGVYLLHRELTLKGPDVSLIGQGPQKSILKAMTSSQDGIRFEDNGAGERPHNCRLRNFAIVGVGNSTATGCGIVAGKSDKSENYWFQGLLVDGIISQGWKASLWAANLPALTVRDCYLVGSTTSFVGKKTDTFTIQNCVTGNNVGYDGAFTTAAGVRCFQISDTMGAPGGPNFAGLIIAGEHGNCEEFGYMDGGCTLRLVALNTETFSGAYFFKIINGTLSVDQLRVGGLAGPSGFLLEPFFGAYVYLRAERVEFEGYAGKPIVSKGTEYDTTLIVAPELPVEWQGADGTAYAAAPQTDNYFPLKPIGHEFRWGNSEAGNALLRGRTYWIPTYTGINRPDRFLHYYRTSAGTHRQSDLLNENASRVLKKAFSDAGSTSGGSETILESVPTEANLLWENGREIELTAWGSFAGNGNDKKIIVDWLDRVFDSGLLTHNARTWKLTAKIFRASATEARYIVSLAVDGLPEQTVSTTSSLPPTGAGVLSLKAVGSEDGDVLIEGFVAVTRA